jgi:tetratricopeptide (TPR) repeat protein
MKIRYGLVLLMVVGIGLTGCASGGGGGGGGGAGAGGLAGLGIDMGSGEQLEQGESPRETDETDAAEEALEDAAEAAEGARNALYQAALESAEAAIAADSTNPLAWRLAADAAVGLEEYQEADRYLTRAEELRPVYQLQTRSLREQTWLELYNEAIPLVNAGEYEQAAEVFEGAHAMYKERPEVMITLGQIYGQLREHDRSLELLAMAQEVVDEADPAQMDSTVIASWREQAASIPMTRAQVLADAGRTEEAVEAFRQLAADNPEDLLISRNLATLLLQAGRNEEAFDVYDRMLQMEGLGPEDYYSIGVGYYQGEQYERAAEAFGMAADVAVNLRDAIEMQARSLQIDSAYSEIPAVAERWIELDPNNQNAYIILAQAANQLGDAERAQELVAAIEGLAVTMDNLQMRRFPDGGAQVTGGLKNVSLDPGTPVQIEFSFYDAAGNVLGTQSTTVTTGQAEMVETFQVEYSGPERVDGYSYELSYPS